MLQINYRMHSRCHNNGLLALKYLNNCNLLKRQDVRRARRLLKNPAARVPADLLYLFRLLQLAQVKPRPGLLPH